MARRQVEIQVKHLVDVETKLALNQRISRYKVWSSRAERPLSDDEKGEGTATCGDCRAVVSYRLWTAARMRRRRRILAGVAAVSAVVLVVNLVLFVRDPYADVLVVAALPVAFLLGISSTAAALGENGFRPGRPVTPDGTLTHRDLHRVDLVDVDRSA